MINDIATNDRKMKMRKFALIVAISTEWVKNILTADLHMRKSSAKWVLSHHFAEWVLSQHFALSHGD